MDKSGLGQGQTLPLTKMLNPNRVMLIDSTMFNRRRQFPQWYDGYQTMIVDGFPTIAECIRFLNGLTHVIVCETPMNHDLIILAFQRRIRVVFCPNPEFLDMFRRPELPNPWKMVAPTPWLVDRVKARVPDTVVIPPPLFPDDFRTAREANFDRRGLRKFIHVAGVPAVHDRAGTQTVLESLKYTSADFSLVIKSQKPLEYACNDPRVTFDASDPDDNAELFTDADAVIHPRRFGGLNLVMNEALMAGLPVIMPDIEPNNSVLPSDWLVPARKTGSFMARTEVDLYEADPHALASKLDWLCGLSEMDMMREKSAAHAIALKNYAVGAVKPLWDEALAS